MSMSVIEIYHHLIVGSIITSMSYDVIVIGGSFAGLSAALQLAGSRRRVLVMDSGEPRNRFAKFSHGFFGHDGQTPSALLVKARSQLLSYSTVSFVDDMATHSAKAGEEFVVTAATGIVRTASRLILATGVRDNLSTIPGLQERWGESMLHCFYCHGYEVAGRRLGVLATSDRSFQTAMLLPDWSDHVTLFTNGVLTLSSEQLADLRTRGVSVETAPVVALLGDAPALSGLRLDDGRIISVDAVFMSPRTGMASPLADQLGCEFDQGPSGPFIRTSADKQATVGWRCRPSRTQRFVGSCRWRNGGNPGAPIPYFASARLSLTRVRNLSERESILR